MSDSISRREAIAATTAAAIACQNLPLGHAATSQADSRDHGPFVVTPYVQLGDMPRQSEHEQLVVMWHAADHDAAWTVEFRSSESEAWKPTKPVKSTRIAWDGIPAHRVYEAVLHPLQAGSEVEYRVKLGDQIVHSTTARTRCSGSQRFRCVVVGDCGTGSEPQKRIADQIFRRKPSFVFVPGDLVYNHGRISEYRSSFYPSYTAKQSHPLQGAPLMESTVILGARGQHDTQSTLSEQPDGHAFFLYWSFPLNGPQLDPRGHHVYPLGAAATTDALFASAAGSRFPRMANYSFDWGNSHWTVLDTWNPNIDWTDTRLREWLRHDLEYAQKSTWKFVSSYMPPFNSSRMYPQGEKMRVLADLFEDAGVDLVFSGYAHSYQRTYPLRFTRDASFRGPARDPGQAVPGSWQLDKQFDGEEHTRPDGPIYIVTGCGGNPQLHSPEQTDAPSTWQPFTVKYHASLHQFTELDINDRTLTLRQISLTGEELDRITLTKPDAR